MRRTLASLLAAAAIAGAALWWVANHPVRQGDPCLTQALPSADSRRAGTDDVLLTDQPPYGAITVRVGQRLVVVLTDNGIGPWGAVAVTGAALTALGSVGPYTYPCQGPVPLTELALFRAVQPGEAVLASETDAPCRHGRPSCAIPQLAWRRTVTVAPAA